MAIPLPELPYPASTGARTLRTISKDSWDSTVRNRSLMRAALNRRRYRTSYRAATVREWFPVTSSAAP